MFALLFCSWLPSSQDPSSLQIFKHRIQSILPRKCLLLSTNELLRASVSHNPTSYSIYLQKIIYFLIINLQKRAENTGTLLLLNFLEYLMDSSWYNPCNSIIILNILTSILSLILIAIPKHRMRFSWACLPICEYSDIVSVHYFWHNFDKFAIDVALGGFVIEGVVKFYLELGVLIGYYSNASVLC